MCLIYCFDLLELIALHDDIPSSSSWKLGKSGQSNQAIKQSSNQHFDSMTTTAQRAAVVKIQHKNTQQKNQVLSALILTYKFEYILSPLTLWHLFRWSVRVPAKSELGQLYSPESKLPGLHHQTGYKSSIILASLQSVEPYLMNMAAIFAIFFITIIHVDLDLYHSCQAGCCGLKVCPFVVQPCGCVPPVCVCPLILWHCGCVPPYYMCLIVS